MTAPIIYKNSWLLIILLSLSIGVWGQTSHPDSKNKTLKPYKLLTQGNQITIRSPQNIESILVWTSSGHRVLEARSIHKTEYQFQITVRDRFYFIMIRTSEGKTFSEKIGMRI